MPFAWRRFYNLPPNDPRYLDMTVDGMVHDLLLHRLVDLAHDDALDPGMAQAEKLRDDGKAGAGMLERGAAFTEDPANRQRLAAILGKLVKPAARTITIGRVQLKGD